MSTRWSKCFLATSGLILTGLLVGCDIGIGPMMGGQPIPVNIRSNGERIYFTGTSGSGHPITFSGGHMHTQMHGGSCVSCHGVDRQGGARMMPWFWIVAPPITPRSLFGDEHDETTDHGDHPTYTAASLRRAITQGIDPSGKRLHETMPRWSMSEPDLTDLVMYLQGSGATDHIDASGEERGHDDTH